MSMKPRRADAAQNREKLLATAEEMFAKDGLAVSVDEIARVAGVGIATLYRHFPTKQALVAAIAGERFRQFADRAEAIAAGGGPGALHQLVEHMVNEGASKRDFLEALGGKEWTHNPALAPLRARVRRALSDLLAQAQETREVRDDVSYSDLIALTRGLFVFPLEAATRARLLRILFDGLRPPRR